MTREADEAGAMRRALQLARRGPRGLNPQVGAVILDAAGQVIAEGWHRGAGTAHAEVDALSHLAPGQARGATAVVTLEPCNHTGRTGPCAQALLDAGIARVVYAVSDPTPQAHGGAERLAAAGVDVTAGVEREEAAALIADWAHLMRTGRPVVTVKWAQSLDGRSAADDGTSQWITGADARADVHRRRSTAEVIVAGIGTILTDDPALTARTEDGSLHEQQPAPLVLGRREVPAEAAVRRHPLPLRTDEGRDLPRLLRELGTEGVQRVFVEGGPSIVSAFLRDGLADELLVYLAPTMLGGGCLATGDLGVRTISEQRRLQFESVERLGADILLILSPQNRS